MAIGIVVLSIVFQFTAAWFALRLIRITRWLSWSLVAMAIFLMGIRRVYALYNSLLFDQPMQTGQELIALAISSLMLVGMIRLNSWLHGSQKGGQPELAGTYVGFSVFLACLGLLGAAMVGTFAYFTSQRSLSQSINENNLSLARMFAGIAEAQLVPGSGSGPFEVLENFWHKRVGRMPEANLCVVDTSGLVIFNSQTAGQDPAPGDPIWQEIPQFMKGDLASRPERTGHLITAGNREMAVAMVYSQLLKAHFCVHVPQTSIDRQIQKMALPWSASLFLLAGLFFPMALTLMYQAFSLSNRKLEGVRQNMAVIVATIPYGILEVDRNGMVLFASGSLAQMLGHPLEDYPGKSVWNWCYPPGEKHGLERFWVQLNGEPPQPEPFYTRCQHRDGHILDVQLDWNYKRDPLGNIVSYIFIATDITERKKVQAALIASEARYRDLFQNSPIPLLEEDHSQLKKYCDGLIQSGFPDLLAYFDRHPRALEDCASLIRIVDANRAAARLFGTDSLEDLLECRCFPTSAVDFMQFKKDLILLMKGSTHFESPTTRLNHEGEELNIILSLTLAPDALESWERVFVSILDLTEKNRLEAQLRQAQKLDTLGTWAGGIAHDFNNILSPIIGYAEMIRQLPPDNLNSQVYARNILAAANRARELVSQIMTFCRGAEQKQTAVSLQSLISEAIKLLRAWIPTTIEIKLDIDKSCQSVFADPTQLNQVLMNLCTNACYAMKEKGGSLMIRLKRVLLPAEENPHNLPLGNWVQLSISDTGCGVPDSIRARIFDPFFTTKGEEGAGLGLSVVRGIIESLQGYIFLSSKEGQGSVFDVYLQEVSVGALAREDQIPVIPKGDGHILLVDDERAILLMMQEMLRFQGYRLTIASDPESALKLFRQSPADFDLIISDQIMPQMTGAQLIQTIHQVRPQLPAIIISGCNEDEVGLPDQPRQWEFLRKPVTMSQICRTIQEKLLVGASNEK